MRHCTVPTSFGEKSKLARGVLRDPTCPPPHPCPAPHDSVRRVLPERILLVDRDPPLVAAWREAFRGVTEVIPARRDFFEEPADAMVSPGNSFGIMDGGLDAAIRDVLGAMIERRVQAMLAEKHHAELPVGGAEIVETHDSRWPVLVFAPTMRLPEDVSRTTNAYVAFRAILLAVRRHNATNAKSIRSLVCPGLCTGFGAMPPRRCAAQMRIAYRQVRQPAVLPAFEEIHEVHRKMRTAT
jgi:O-acetyl-ADP-ribose deacetylase (regulator of RNase III)